MPTSAPDASAPDQDGAFAALASRFLHDFLAHEPTLATSVGMHDFDDKWPDRSADGDAELLRFLQETRAAVAAIPKGSLSRENAIDARILENQVAWYEYARVTLKRAENDPQLYTSILGDGLDPLATRDFAPVADRMKSLRARLAGVTGVVATAKARVGRPARISTETAIKQTRGLVGLCEKELEPVFAQVPDQKSDLEAAAKGAATALRDFQTFLEKEVLPRSDGSFRAGKDTLDKILSYDLEDTVTSDDLAKDARALLAQTQEDMYTTAAALYPSVVGEKKVPVGTTPEEKKKIVRTVLAKLADDRSTNTTIVADATKLLGDATDFVRTHDLVTLPVDPCKVIEMPEYRRGVTVAYCESSGPLEKKQETFFAIAPAPADWPAKRVTSLYREYNHSMLADLVVHEAMPGHYLQAMHANQFKSDVRSVFANGAFVEGWAVYGEWLMAKYGFGGDKAKLQRLKMLARVAANAVLDHEIHAGTMEEDAAIALMTNEAFQEEGEAVGKWTRARVTRGQLSTYFYGFREMMKLRQAAERQSGFSERAYHDALLSHGAPAMRYARELMAP
jgi:uncharacterized protein (DUF885 family)